MPIPDDIFQKVADAICRPEGTVGFEYTSTDAFQDDQRKGIILEIPSGGHYFRLDKTERRVLRFFHSSPGTGTRVASIDLKGLPEFEKAFLSFTWSPDEIHLYCGPRGIGTGLMHAAGVSSPTSFRIGQDGPVFQLGDAGVQVMGVRVRREGTLVLDPTAIDVWNSTVQAIEMLWTGKSDQGFMFEVLQATSSLAMLVTGLENYAKTRLLEIEKEGNEAAPQTLFDAFSSKAVRESNRFAELQAIAADTRESVFSTVLENLRINFQDFDSLKGAFKASYGVKIGEIGIPSDTLAELRTLIRYRHRVIHVSPLVTMLNEDEVPPAEPVFANRVFSDRASEVFRSVVEPLHKATTSLRPDNAG